MVGTIRYQLILGKFKYNYNNINNLSKTIEKVTWYRRFGLVVLVPGYDLRVKFFEHSSGV